MDPKIGDWVWHYAAIYPSGQRAALVVATEGAARKRGDVALMFDNGGVYWLISSRIGPCSRDEAIKYRNELKAQEPERNTVEEVENHARKWWQKHGLKTP